MKGNSLTAVYKIYLVPNVFDPPAVTLRHPPSPVDTFTKLLDELSTTAFEKVLAN